MHSLGIPKDTNGKVEEIHTVLEKLTDSCKKPRSFIHWVAHPLHCEVRLYEKLCVYILSFV